MFTHYMSTPHVAHTATCIFPEGTKCTVPGHVLSYVSFNIVMTKPLLHSDICVGKKRKGKKRNLVCPQYIIIDVSSLRWTSQGFIRPAILSRWLTALMALPPGSVGFPFPVPCIIADYSRLQRCSELQKKKKNLHLTCKAWSLQLLWQQSQPLTIGSYSVNFFSKA